MTILPSVFQDAPEPDIFVSPPAIGTGSETTDDFISTRVGLMSDDPDTIRALRLAQEGVKNLDHDGVRALVGNFARETFQNLEVRALNKYAEAGDIEGGAEAIQAIREAGNQPDEIQQFAAAVVADLEQYPEASVSREVARRNIVMWTFAQKMEEYGITPKTWQDSLSALGGTLIPGRQIYQYATSGDFDLYDRVRQMQTLDDKEFFEQLPGVLDEVMKMSGENPFYFMERAQALLDPQDIASLKIVLGLDAFDAGSLLLGLPALRKLVSFARASNTPIKLLRDTGDFKRAAELNAAAMGDDGVAETLRTTRGDAASTASPFGGEGLDPNITNKLAAETQAVIAERTAKVDDILQPLHDQGFLLRRQNFTPEAKAARQEKYLSQFAGEARVVDQFDDGFEVEVVIQKPNIWPKKSALQAKLIELQDLKRAYKEAWKKAPTSTGQKQYLREMIDQTRDEINRYETILERIAHRSDDLPTPVEVARHRVMYTQNDFGELDAVQFTRSSRHINSPSTNVEQMLGGAVERATQAGFDTDRVLDVFMRARSAAIRGLDKKRRQKLDQVLLQGDRDQVYYDDMTLVSGVRTPEGLVKFTTAEEIAAYRSVRKVYDHLYDLKNVEMRRSLELGGFKAIYPRVKDGTILDEVESMNFVNPNKIISIEERANIKRIFNDSTGQVEDVKNIDPESILDFEIYEFKYPMTVGDEIVEYVITKPTKLRELPRYVLNKRDGYVPKINKNIFWVAEMLGPKMKNGVVVENFSTVVRYFDNPIDAETWTAAQNAKGQVVRYRSGREWLDSQPGHIEQFEAQIFGGLYGGKRSMADVPFGLEGTEAERMGGVEAMEAYMNHIATRMPAVNFRAMLIHKFMSSAKDPITKKSWLTNPGDWQSPLDPALKGQNHKLYSGLKTMQDWIKDQVRIPTTEERVWGFLSQKLADITSRVPGAGRTLSRWSMQIGAKDAFTQARGLAFHATLGWFNESQLFVQAMGASIAASINPLTAPRNIARSLALRASMFAKSEKAIRIAAKAALQNEDDFVQLVRAYQRTGLHESTLSTGDYAALAGLPHGMDGFRWLANKGLIFFKEGERFARNFAWLQAYDKVMRGRKFVGAIPDDVIEEITNLSLRYTLNLNRANRAWWQKGILSIPTQFWQISTKFIEHMMPNMIVKTPNGWTGKEKSFILLGQVILFGAAGIPFGTAMTDNLLTWLESDDEFGMGIKDPEIRTAISGGLTEFMMYRWTGERYDITNRLSIPAGIEQMIEIMTSESKTAGDLLFGVSGEIGHRVWESLKLNGLILHSVLKEPETLDKDVVLEILDNTGQIVSSWRNYQKARLWLRLQAIPDRNGKRIMPVNDVDNRGILLAQAMGIAPKEIDDYYAMNRELKSTEQDYRDAANAVMQINQRYYNDPDIITNTKKQTRMATEISITLAGYTDEERLLILERVNDRLKNDDYLLPEVMEKALDQMYRKQSGEGFQTNATMVEE